MRQEVSGPDGDPVACFHETLSITGSRALLPYRGPYTVTMREDDGLDDVMHALASESAETIPRRLHLGWGSFRNFDIAAARRSSFLILCDASQRQLDAWGRIAALIAVCETPADFIAQLPLAMPAEPRPRFFGESLEGFLKEDAQTVHSWLARRDRYAWVRDICRGSRLATLAVDLRDGGDGDTPVFTTLRDRLDTLRRRGVAVPDSFYLSNLMYMMARPEGFFGEKHSAADENLRRVLANLRELVPLFRHVIDAHELSVRSRPGDLRWQTRLNDANDFFRCFGAV